ncbi:hypothetical protein DFH09DRAFT_1481212 [Mycena vulgaris]|nr:hypothetical protein DFH09DRAFT_1481212 [Mycena vulgaris]
MSIAGWNQFQCSSEFTRPQYAGSKPPSPVFAHNPPRTFNSVAGKNDTAECDFARRVRWDWTYSTAESSWKPCTIQLNTWSIHAGATESNVIWLNGSAGIGKSAIAQIFAGECQTQGRPGASFFFKRGHHKRGTWDGLFTTIAYQLATAIPGLSLSIQQAVEGDKLVGGRAMPLQFRRLIVEPFQQTAPLGFLSVIVVDGLDECDDHRIQQQILSLFIEAMREKQLPICLLICSHPEPHLREQLNMEQSSVVCGSLVLSADRLTYEDVRTFLRDTFSTIHSEYQNRGIPLDDPWPSPEALEHQVKKSSGIFIYATTVIRFVGNKYSHPAD